MRHNRIGRIEVEKYPKSNDSLLREIRDAVNEFIKAFQKKLPLQFLYEADIQAQLACCLTNKIDASIKFKESAQSITHHLTPITCEYPVGKRFDIACINPELVKAYIDWLLTSPQKDGLLPINFVLWELPLLAAIEIKYSTFGGGGSLQTIKQDVEKLKSYEDWHEARNNKLTKPPVRFSEDFKFLALHFFQDDSYFNDRLNEYNEYNEYREPLRPIESVDKFNCIYWISHEKIIQQI